MTFDVETVDHDDHVVVVPRGEIDMAGVPPFRHVITELMIAGRVDVVVDLNEVTFMDSTGLGVLIGARRKAHVFRGSFRLVCTNPRILDILRMTSLDRVFEILEERPDRVDQITESTA